jgi:hypothetical protein
MHSLFDIYSSVPPPFHNFLLTICLKASYHNFVFVGFIDQSCDRDCMQHSKCSWLGPKAIPEKFFGNAFVF